MSKPSRRESAAAPSPALVGVHDGKRVKARWFFLAALVLAVLAFFVLPTPFSGVSALLCVGAFVSGGTRGIEGGDPEMVKQVTRGLFPGGGGF